MNILILEEEEVGERLPRSDRRWEHVKKVLKKKPGERLSAGLATDDPSGPAPGRLGEATILELDDQGLRLGFEAFKGPAGEPAPLAPLSLILGFPRPIQANRILKDLTSLGVAEIHLTGTDLGEKSYVQSSMFKDRDFRRPLLEGAEQAGNPRLPRVSTHWSLSRCLAELEADPPPSLGAPGSRLFLHPYGDGRRMGGLGRIALPLCLAIGSERGWTEKEIALLEGGGFEAATMGTRILKTETAALAATILALAALELL